MARRRSSTAAAAGAVLDGVRRQLGQGWPAGLTVLTGDDTYHMDQAQRLLLETLVPADATDFALTSFGDEKVALATVVGAARSVAMFASSRVVFVRDFAALTGEPDALLEYAASPPDSSYLIVRAPALDLRRKLHKALTQAGKTLRFALPKSFDPRRAATQVKAMAGERGLTVDADAAAFLGEVTAGDLYALHAEMDKLRTYLAGAARPRVTLAVAREVAAGGDLLSGWELADAILARDYRAGLAAVARLMDAGEEPLRIVGGVAWRARMMLQARAMLEGGASSREVIQATRAWAYGDAMLAGMRRYTLPELLRFPALLLEADRALKGSALTPRVVLERLVDRMTAPASDPASRLPGALESAR